MSWSFYLNEPTRAAEAKTAVLAAHPKGGLPDTMKLYINAGIDGLMERFGGNVFVTVKAHGHLCDGPSSYEVTSAFIDVQKAEQPALGEVQASA